VNICATAQGGSRGQEKRFEDARTDFTDPPGASPSIRRNVRRVLAPVERFLAIEAASGIVLMLAAAIGPTATRSAGRSSAAFGPRNAETFFPGDIPPTGR
jgi:hypothetical protein